MQVSCTWESSLDAESPLVEVQVGVGSDQLRDDLVPFTKVTIKETSWSFMLEDSVFDVYENATAVVSLLADNTVSGTYLFIFS